MTTAVNMEIAALARSHRLCNRAGPVKTRIRLTPSDRTKIANRIGVRRYFAVSRAAATSASVANRARKEMADRTSAMLYRTAHFPFIGRLLLSLPRTRQNPARQRARQLPAFHHEFSVHQHRLDSLRILVRLLEGRLVPDRGRIENDNVGGQAFAEQAAILDSENLSGQRSRRAHRVFDRDDAA